MSWLGRKMISRRFGWRQLLGVLLLALVVSVGITGCSSGSATPGPTPTPTPTPAPTPTPTPAPSITTISPNGAATGAVAFTLNVKGSNFVSGSTVNWNGSSRTTTFVSSTQLQALIMAADLAAPGKATVTAVNSPGGTSNAATFTIAAATIVFQSTRALDGSDAANTNATSNIWAMNPDGSSSAALTKLTASAADSRNPVWSPDGTKIAFRSERALDGSNAVAPSFIDNIWMMNADGSGQTPLTKLTVGGAETFDPVWSPDGAKIAFLSARALDGSDSANSPNLTTNVWVMNADGSNQKPLTKTTALNADHVSPLVWSPDGAKLAFSSAQALDGSDAANVNQARNIWVVNADGSGLTPLTRLTVFFALPVSPAWSPDGSKIVYASVRALDGSDGVNTNNAQNIWVANADGSSQKPLTKLTASNTGSFDPAWSPDGAKVAFASRRALDGSDAGNTNTTPNIWEMNADGSSPTPLTKLTAVSVPTDTPIWTPGGTQLLFVSSRALNGSDAANTNSTQNIWLMNADGTSPTPLTKLTSANASSISPAQP